MINFPNCECLHWFCKKALQNTNPIEHNYLSCYECRQRYCFSQCWCG